MAERMTIARPYARAVFEIATQTNAREEWSIALQALSMIVEHPKTLALLKNNAIPVEDLAGFFQAVGERYMDDRVRPFIAILAEAKRLIFLPEISVLYQRMRQEAENTLNVDFISAIELDDAQKASFQTALESYFLKNVQMQYSVDASLLGGFLAKAGNDVIDGSLRGRLTELKKVMGE